MSGGLFEDRITRNDNQTCPWCHAENDASLSMRPDGEDHTPKTGDVGICAQCVMPLIYQEVGPPRVPTEGEWANINDDDNITKIRRELFMANAKIGKVTRKEGHLQVRDEGGEDA